MNARFQPGPRTMADLLRHLGDISPERVRLDPTPGTATIDDLLPTDNELCELVDGTLVEKAVGWQEGFLQAWLGMVLNQFVLSRNLGAVVPGDTRVHLAPGVGRAPDIAFTSWDRLPGRRPPSAPIPAIAPDLAIEVLSISNTPREMDRKRADYFGAGVRLVWEIDPRARTVRVYTAADTFSDLTPADTLDGGDVLPGLAIPLADLFGELDRHG